MHYKQALLLSTLAGLVAAVPTDLKARTVEKRSTFIRDLVSRDPEAHVNEPAAVTEINNTDGIGAGTDQNIPYAGDGTTNSGWPSQEQWVSFEDMFNANKPVMFIACDYFQVPDDSEEEVQAIYDGVQSIAAAYGVDHRFILAVIMQESHGCVRAPSTHNGVHNPGLMQDHDGTATCNEDYVVTTPCATDTITQMIKDGGVGTEAGNGLATLLNMAQDAGAVDAQTFYVAATWYNSGELSVVVGGDLSSVQGATATYATSIANRLTGWTG